MGNGQWAMGIKRSDRVFHLPHAPCPMPHAQCPMPNLPNWQLSPQQTVTFINEFVIKSS